jgi:hypothetical protein
MPEHERTEEQHVFPFIFDVTDNLKDGTLEDERKRVPELCEFICARGARTRMAYAFLRPTSRRGR